MKRPRLTNLAAWASLVLCVALTAAWVRSGFRTDNVEGTLGREPGATYLSFVSSSGLLAAAYMPDCPWPQRWEWGGRTILAGERQWFAADFRLRKDVMQFYGLGQGA